MTRNRIWLWILTARDGLRKRFGAPVPADMHTPGPKNGALTALRIGLLVLALILILYGIHNGSMLDVLYKARKICTECVGLG